MVLAALFLNGNGENMNIQNYLMINETTAVVDNICLWDGDTSSWQPPTGYLLMPQATTLAKVWFYNQEQSQYELVAQEGEGQIGFTWDGEVLTTNEPEPTTPPN